MLVVCYTTTTFGTHLYFDLLMIQQWHKEWYDARLNNHLYLIVAAVCEVRQCPHCVYQDLKQKRSVMSDDREK